MHSKNSLIRMNWVHTAHKMLHGSAHIVLGKERWDPEAMRRLQRPEWHLRGEHISVAPMKDMLAHLAKGKIFSKLDLREEYYRVWLKAGDEWKTVFNCPLDCFQYWVLPFGLQGAPAVFMQLINEVLHKYLFKWVLVYLDYFFNLYQNYGQTC